VLCKLLCVGEACASKRPPQRLSFLSGIEMTDRQAVKVQLKFKILCKSCARKFRLFLQPFDHVHAGKTRPKRSLYDDC
jgi:hypothetical protein